MKNITKYLVIFLLALATQFTTTNAIWKGTTKELKKTFQKHEERLEKEKEKEKLNVSDEDYNEFYEQNLKQSKSDSDLYLQLNEAAQKGDLAHLTHLIQVQGASVNRIFYIFKSDPTQPTNTQIPWGVSLLHMAVMQNNLKVVKCLVENGAAINAHDELYYKTPLEYAIKYKHLFVVKYLKSVLKEQEKNL